LCFNKTSDVSELIWVIKLNSWHAVDGKFLWEGYETGNGGASVFDLSKSLPFHSPAVGLQRLGSPTAEGQPINCGPVEEKGEFD